jgi:hypothetical protein
MLVSRSRRVDDEYVHDEYYVDYDVCVYVSDVVITAVKNRSRTGLATIYASVIRCQYWRSAAELRSQLDSPTVCTSNGRRRRAPRKTMLN